MGDTSSGPAFMQIGSHNSQHNHYYGVPPGVRLNAAAGLVGSSDLGPFALVARLAVESGQVSIINATSEEMTRRAARPPSPTEDLLICRRLASLIATDGDWQLRRALSHSLGYTLLALDNHDELTRIIAGDLLEYARTSANFSVMLSIASTANSTAAHVFSSGVQEAYALPHPQVLWQHSRDPSLSAATDGLGPLIDAVLDREDPWIKRRLISSCLLHASKGELSDWDKITRLLGTLRGDDARYMRLLMDWIDPLDLLDVSNALAPHVRKGMKRDQPPYSRVGLDELLTAEPHTVRSNLEMMSLDLDMQKISAPAVRNQTMVGGGGKGRYSTIEGSIAYLLTDLSSDARESLFAELFDSSDEGIRWAAAAQFDLGLPGGRIGDAQAAQVLRLLADPHPWVVRESLTTLARSEFELEEPNVRRLAASSVAALSRAESHGWPKSELMPAIAGLIASKPRIAEHFVLSVRESEGK